MRRIALVIVAILIGSAFSVPSASGTVVGEAGGVVGSVVESVDPPDAVPSHPSPPSAPAPAKPPPPTPPPPPVKSPAEAPPPPSPPASGGDAPSPDRIVGAVRDSVDSIASTGRDTTQRAIAPTGNYRDRVSDGGRATDGGRAAASASGRDGDVKTEASRPDGTGSNAPPSIAAAEVAALRRWLARVWPAIALGGGAGDGWGAGVIADLLLLRPAAVVTARLLTPPAAGAPGGPGPVGHPATANAPQPAPPATPASPDEEKTVYLVVFAALLAFLVFTIWREFRTTLRPGVR
jgi:hypothetical protein